MTKEKMKKATALRYDPGRDPAPKVVAKGRGKAAERIMEIARQHQIPLVENPNLAQMLDALDIDVEIPQALYQAVAEVLVFIYRLNQKTP
jgi:flagellar biosynthesis protein